MEELTVPTLVFFVLLTFRAVKNNELYKNSVLGSKENFVKFFLQKN